MVRHWGSRVNIGDAFEGILGLVEKWHPVLESMNPGLPGNNDLVEVMQNIHLDGGRE